MDEKPCLVHVYRCACMVNIAGLTSVSWLVGGFGSVQVQPMMAASASSEGLWANSQEGSEAGNHHPTHTQLTAEKKGAESYVRHLKIPRTNDLKKETVFEGEF